MTAASIRSRSKRSSRLNSSATRSPSSFLAQGLPGLRVTSRTADVDAVVALEHDALADYTPDGHVAALTAFVRTLAPAHIVFVHTYRTRDYAPRLAAKLGRPLATDCTAVRRDRCDRCS